MGLSGSAAAPTTLAMAKRLVESHDHLTGEEVSDVLLGRPSAHHLTRLRNGGTVLALRFVRRGYFYPAFQFDIGAGRVDPRVVKVNRMLTASWDTATAIAWWWDAERAGSRPADLLAQGRPTRVVQMAREATAVPARPDS